MGKNRFGNARPWLGLNGLLVALMCLCLIVLVNGSGDDSRWRFEGNQNASIPSKCFCPKKRYRWPKKRYRWCKKIDLECENSACTIPSSLIVFVHNIVFAILSKPNVLRYLAHPSPNWSGFHGMIRKHALSSTIWPSLCIYRGGWRIIARTSTLYYYIDIHNLFSKWLLIRFIPNRLSWSWPSWPRSSRGFTTLSVRGRGTRSDGENEAVPKPVDLIHWPGVAPNSKASLASKEKVVRA